MNKELFKSLFIVTLAFCAISTHALAEISPQSKDDNPFIHYHKKFSMDCPANYPCPRPNLALDQSSPATSEDSNHIQANYPTPTPNQRLE